MKNFISIFFYCLLSQVAICQNTGTQYLLIVTDAEYLKKTGDHLGAGKKYEEAFALVGDSKVEWTDMCNAAICWSTGGDKDKAFELLNKLVQPGVGTNSTLLSKKYYFRPLHDDPRWDEFMYLLEHGTVQSQKEKIEQQWYAVNKTFWNRIKQFSSVHLPLDGNVVEMIPFRKGTIWGFVNTESTNDWLIEPTYKHIYAVYKEGAVVQEKGSRKMYGLLNKEGKYVIPAQYKTLKKEKNIYHGLRLLYTAKTLKGAKLPLVENEKTTGSFVGYLCDYYNEKGNLVFSEKAVDYASFGESNNLAWFRFGNKVTVRNREGKVVKKIFIDKDVFVGVDNDLLLYHEKGAYGVYLVSYDIKGKEKARNLIYKMPTPTIQYDFSKAREESYQLSAHLIATVSVSGVESAVSFIDTKRNKEYEGFFYESGFFIPEDYFSRNLFRVNPLGPEAEQYDNWAMGVINREGELIIGYDNGKLPPFVNGLMYIDTKDMNSLFFDEKGDSLLIKDVHFPYYRGYYKTFYPFGKMGFYEELCVGMEANINRDSTDLEYYYYYFDKKGKKVLTLPGDIIFAGHFSGGVASVINKEEKLGFIDKKGNWIIEPTYNPAEFFGNRYEATELPSFKGAYAYLKGKGYINSEGKSFFSEN